MIRPGTKFQWHLLPGEQCAWIADTGMAVIVHPARQAVTVWRDAAGVLREETIVPVWDRAQHKFVQDRLFICN